MKIKAGLCLSIFICSSFSLDGFNEQAFVQRHPKNAVDKGVHVPKVYKDDDDGSRIEAKQGGLSARCCGVRFDNDGGGGSGDDGC